jgi:hypothetical protein
MKTMSRLDWLRGRNGSAIIFIAVTLMILVAFAGLAIDVGYLYVVRGELQNAADAGALAGAQVLFDDPDNPSDIPGRYVNAGANAVAQRYVEDHFSENVMARAISIERGHWSFATRTFTRNDLLDPWATVDLWKHTEAELDANPDFINAVRVVTRRKRAEGSDPNDPNAPAPSPFFINVVTNQAAEVSAVAVAYIGFAGTLAPFEVDQPVALCQDKLTDTNGVYSCNTGRMLNNNDQTARWTDYTQPEGGNCTAQDSAVPVCQGPTHPLILFEPFATTNGTQGENMADIRDCWLAANIHHGQNGMPDEPWKIYLPVVNGPCGGGGCVFNLVGSVAVNVLWITGLGNDPQFKDIPMKMSNMDNNVANWVCPSGATEDLRKACWLDFVKTFNIMGASGNLATLDDYQAKSMYWAPNCTPNIPRGVSGGRNFGVLARIPVLVK